MSIPYISASAVAGAIPFDNSTDGFASTNVQAAIEEVRSFFTTPATDQNYYVTKNGNDTTGNGSIGQPYLTIGHALSVITDSSSTKRYVINVGPGDYPENLVLKANIFIKGNGPIATRITGSTINITDTTWNNGNDNRSGFQDISLNNVATWDFTSETSDTSGKLYFFNIRTGAAWIVNTDNAIQQIIIQDSEMFGTTTFNGCNTFASSTTWQSGNIVVNSVAVAGVPANFTAIGCNIQGNISATWTSNAAVTLSLSALTITATTTLTASGTSCSVLVCSGSLPIPANRTFSSGATFTRLNDNYASGLISATTNVDTTAATAPSVGQILTATSSSLAIWQYDFSVLANFGDGSDGDVSLSSGTTTLARDMYYNSLTLSSTAILKANGWKIFSKGAIAISGTAEISNDGNAGTAGSGGTVGAGGAAAPGNSVGASIAGGTGGAFGNNTAGSPGGAAAAGTGYGVASTTAGAGGNSGSNLAAGGAGGIPGTYTYIPERIVRFDHIINLAYKVGGQGGSGGGGGASSLLATAGAGGGGGSGGGVVEIFCGSINNTSSVGITAKGGAGGAGGSATGGNSGGGGGGSGGSGGQIYIVANVITALGTLTVSGGTAGAAGALAGTGHVGNAGAAGSTGHTTAYAFTTNTWTVT